MNANPNEGHALGFKAKVFVALFVGWMAVAFVLAANGHDEGAVRMLGIGLWGAGIFVIGVPLVLLLRGVVRCAKPLWGILKTVTPERVARWCVLGYALFVIVSLFLAPWRGWTDYERESGRVNPPHQVVRFAPIFNAPQGLYGTDPRRGRDHAKQTPPKLLFQEIVLTWAALGVLTISAVWLGRQASDGGKQSESKGR